MSSKTKNWTEEDFRKELRRLDAMVQEKQGITLVGAEFEIQFMNTRRTLGYYYPTQKRFRFSLPFFNSDVPENCALDVIRHEYAHYYAHAVYGYRGVHGKPFKEACIAVGANPETYYSLAYERRQREREENAAKIYQSSLCAGQQIVHPFFGKETILEIKNRRDGAALTVFFPEKGEKTLDEQWLCKNGKILPAKTG